MSKERLDALLVVDGIDAFCKRKVAGNEFGTCNLQPATCCLDSIGKNFWNRNPG